MSDPTQEEEKLELWTIGHSTHDQPSFIKLLQQHGINLLIDIRTYPGSKRYPQYNQDQLSEGLANAGIGYEHLAELGGRRKIEAESANTNWHNPSFRAYADHMMTSEFRQGIEKLINLAKGKRAVIMCAEAGWWRCHRGLIADYLKLLGFKIIHILGIDKTEEHPFTSAATVEDEKLSYGGPTILDAGEVSAADFESSTEMQRAV